MDPISARGLASVSLPPDSGAPGKTSKSDGFQNAMKSAEIKADPQVETQKVDTKQVGDVQKSERTATASSGHLDQFVRGVETDAKFLERQMTRLGRGADLSTAEILQLQGVSYRHAQQVELAAKLVEKVIGGFKQVLNTQV